MWIGVQANLHTAIGPKSLSLSLQSIWRYELPSSSWSTTRRSRISTRSNSISSEEKKQSRIHWTQNQLEHFSGLIPHLSWRSSRTSLWYIANHGKSWHLDYRCHDCYVHWRCWWFEESHTGSMLDNLWCQHPPSHIQNVASNCSIQFTTLSIWTIQCSGLWHHMAGIAWQLPATIYYPWTPLQGTPLWQYMVIPHGVPQHYKHVEFYYKKCPLLVAEEGGLLAFYLYTRKKSSKKDRCMEKP